MAANGFGGGDKFKPAGNNLERQVFQMGRGPVMVGAPLQGEGNIPVAGAAPVVQYASIGKGDQGVRGATPIRVMGASSPFSQQQNPGMGSFAPAPHPSYPPQPQPQPMAPAVQHPSLGAGDEVHTLVAKLQGPSGTQYEAVYEVVVPERGSRVLGVTER